MRRIWDTVTYSWHCGRLVRLRYAVGGLHETLFGYEPDGDAIQFRLARWAGLSGY